MKQQSKYLDVKSLIQIIIERGASCRTMTAIAGPPSSGKSTFAEYIVKAINKSAPESAAVFSMDGYHYDDRILLTRGWLPRKGAPHTFDISGFRHMLLRLKANDESEIAVPVFDREIEIARNSARLINHSVRYLMVEGNYLLLNEKSWSDMLRYFDTTVFLDVPMQELQKRLEARWKTLSSDEFKKKLEENDFPNARLVVENSLSPEFFIKNSPNLNR